MNFGQAISTCLSKYATFSGRAARSEFLWFSLFALLVSTVAAAINDKLYGLIALGLLLPTIAVSTRRLHDIGKSGWWQLLTFTGIGYFVLIYWWVQPTADNVGNYDSSSS
jgi:uncharacterized membrane protein YhaH (DUF805 family)